jgi:hypothetical protein
VLLPLQGLTQGQQLAWYLHSPATGDDRQEHPALSSAAVATAVGVLTDLTGFRSAQDFPWGRKDLDQPGLYAWQVDDEGARDLSAGSGLVIRPGLVYAGQAGATAWPSGKAPASTLLTRIRDNHLRGRLTSSTWRLSLAALLQEPLRLEVRAKDLEVRSQVRLTSGMISHLRLAVHPVPDRDALGGLASTLCCPSSTRRSTWTAGAPPLSGSASSSDAGCSPPTAGRIEGRREVRRGGPGLG